MRSGAGPESPCDDPDHEKPLEEATTASRGVEGDSATMRAGFGGCDARLPLLERAVELDPEFALAHAGLSVWQRDRPAAVGDSERDPRYELRQRTTDPERFFIEYAHDRDVTGDLERAPDRHAVDPDLSSRSQCARPARWLQRARHRQVRG